MRGRVTESFLVLEFEMIRFSQALGAIGVLAVVGSACAQDVGDVRVDVTNLGNSDFFLTPAWFAFSNGTFDFFDVGSAASSSLEAIAEVGDVSGLVTDFANSGVPGNLQGVAANPAGFGGAPVIDPGETATAYVTPMNPAAYQFFSFASMVIPSNDSFIGNDDPLAYRVFDDNGDLTDASGTFTIQIFGSDIWDAGTEQNTGTGAAFSTLGGMGLDEQGVVTLTTQPGDLSVFLGTQTPAGTTINTLIDPQMLLATIQISIVPVPTPGVAGLLGLAGLGLVRRKR